MVQICSLLPNQFDHPHKMVGVEGFEPPTSATQMQWSTRLTYTPNSWRPKNGKNYAAYFADSGTPQHKTPKTLYVLLEMGVRKRGSYSPCPGCVERDSKIKAERVDSGNHQGGTI